MNPVEDDYSNAASAKYSVDFLPLLLDYRHISTNVWIIK